MTTILYAHPYSGSFNHAVMEEVKKQLAEQGEDYQMMDLYADRFNPVLEADSLRLYSRGETADPLAKKYLDMLLHTDRMVMIFPVWWGMMPAIVTGFFDKVMLSGTAYGYDESGRLIPAKIDIAKTLIFTTSQSPAKNFKPFFAEYIKQNILDAIGFHDPEWHDCEETAHGPEENRIEFLRLVGEKIKTTKPA